MSYFPSISQNVIVDTVNSVSGVTIVNYVNPADIWNYNGVGSSTLGVNAIQLVVTSTKNLDIYVDQGNTSSSFQLTDTYNYLTTKQFGLTVQAVGAYVRVRAKNTSGASAVATIDTVLCPIIEALPRSLDEYGNLKVSIKDFDDQNGFEALNTPTHELRTIVPIKLVGVGFEGTTIDPNFWTSITQSGGTITQLDGRINLLTNTLVNGSATLCSVRRARYNTGSSLYFRANMRVGDTGTANNVRQWGVGIIANYTLTITATGITAGDVYSDVSAVQYTVLISSTGTTATVYATASPTTGARTYTRISGTGAPTLTGSAFAITSVVTDGYYFQLSGTTFSVVSEIGNISTPVNSGSFNGDYGATAIPSTNVTTYEIIWNPKNTYFFIDGAILHTMSGPLTPLSNTQSLFAFLNNSNINGGSTNVGLYCRSLSIKRLGPLLSQPISKYLTGTSTTILKYGPGNIHSVICGGVAGTIVLYDGLSANAPIIISTSNSGGGAAPFSMNCKGVPFFNGLCCVTSGACLATIIYE